MRKLRILIVAPNVSKKMGGEAKKVFIYMRRFALEGHVVWLVCHERVKQELVRELSNNELQRVYFSRDTLWQIYLWKFAKLFPSRIQEFVFSPFMTLLFLYDARKISKQLIKTEFIQVVFQPTPNTPLTPSALYNLGVPVVMGPLSGGVEFPPAFKIDSWFTRWTLWTIRWMAMMLNKLCPGRRLADIIMVANNKTESLLPNNCTGRIIKNFVECGVDLEEWSVVEEKDSDVSRKATVRFIYTGRIVELKGITYLIEAFKNITDEVEAELVIVGEGEQRQLLEQKVQCLNLSSRVHFTGWKNKTELKKILADSDIFILPSLHESCGNSVLEAMAMKLPVVVSDWGGPAELVNDSCGVKIPVDSKDEFVACLSKSMLRLAKDDKLRQVLGSNGLKRIHDEHYDWESKVDYILRLFDSLVPD